MPTEEKFPVLIVGGGIVGLSASLFLSFHGVDSLLVERRSNTSIHPRSRSLNGRTMELYRNVGVDEAVRVTGAELNLSMGAYKGPSLAEVIETKKRNKDGTTRDSMPGSGLVQKISPATGTRGTQDLIEPVLLAAARERGGEVRFNSECAAFQQDDSGVMATVCDRASGATYNVRADYLLAADGASSKIRQKLDLKMTGAGLLGNLLNILFEADLRELVRGREFSLCLIERPELRGLFTSINNSDRWVFHLSYDPANGENAEDYSIHRCQALIKTALGMAEVPVEIKSILPWQSAVRVAEKFQQGRVFLAGDAAHQMPPWGGQGANGGIADVHNLAWKLAAVLRRQAGSELLTTYDSERLPVGRIAATESGEAADEHGLLALDWRAKLRIVYKWTRLLGYGYRYASKVIITDDASPFIRIPWFFFAWMFGLDGRPGARAPHIWAQHQGQRVSTLDLCRKNFVLLAGSDGGAWREAALAASVRLGISVVAYCIGPYGDLLTSKGEWESIAGISTRGALLVRPDGYVAWRAYQEPANLEQKLEEVLMLALCR